MGNFKHGVLVEDGVVRFRDIDLIAIAWNQKHNSEVGQDVINALFDRRHKTLSAKEAKEIIAQLRQELDWFEGIFNRLEEVTPEWLDQHFEEL